MVQVSIPFCLELEAETETFQEEPETKLVFRALSTAPAFLCRQGRTQRRRGGGGGGVRGGAQDRRVDIEERVSVQFSSFCILTVRSVGVLEINQLNKIFSKTFAFAL